jgi:hypothetical protein
MTSTILAKATLRTIAVMALFIIAILIPQRRSQVMARDRKSMTKTAPSATEPMEWEYNDRKGGRREGFAFTRSQEDE